MKNRVRASTTHKWQPEITWLLLSLSSRPTDLAWKVFWPEQHKIKLVWPNLRKKLMTVNKVYLYKVPVAVQLVIVFLCSVHPSLLPQSVGRWKDTTHHMVVMWLVHTLTLLQTYALLTGALEPVPQPWGNLDTAYWYSYMPAYVSACTVQNTNN